MQETIYKAPDVFSKKYFEWRSKVRQISWANELRETMHQISYNELVTMLKAVHPTRRADVHWFAILELSRRSLTDQQIEAFREVWEFVPLTTKKNMTCIMMTFRERMNIKKLLDQEYQH